VSTFNNLGVSNTLLNVYGAVTVLGNITVNNSHIDLEYSETIVAGDLSLLNSSITFSNSSILVDGCIYLNSTESQQILLLKSQSSCLIQNGKVTFTFSNQERSCDTASHEITQSTLVLTISVIQECSKGTQLFSYLSLLILMILLTIQNLF